MINWSTQQTAAFGHDIVQAQHLSPAEPFTDGALAALIDSYPRERMQAFLSGTDLARREELTPVDLRGLSGADCLKAVRAGRIWFKLQRIDTQAPYGDLLQRLYGKLQADVTGFRPSRIVAVLIISSPGALVYFHADAKPNVLWHMRGRKQVRLYPGGHRTLISQSDMEDIFANAIDEEVAYSPEFEKAAVVRTLHPQQFLCWPQNTPHAVIAEGDLNVSISSFHETLDSDRRAAVYGFNRFIRNRLGRHLSARDRGLSAATKAVAYKLLRRGGLIKPYLPNREYVARWRLDPGHGVTRIDPIRTEFR